MAAPIGTTKIWQCNKGTCVQYRRVKTKDGWFFEHRIVAEAKIGRPLKPGEHVHHLDGDGLNNAPDNISVLTQQEHRRIHALDPRRPPQERLILTNPRPPMGRWSYKYDACQKCHTTERRHAYRGLCDRCVLKVAYGNNPEMRSAQKRRYYLRHGEEIRAKNRAYYHAVKNKV